MAATIEVREKNTVAETPTIKTSGSVRFKVADNALVDLNNPIVRPGAGSTRSYEKWLRLFIGATGPSGSITNPRAYSDGVNHFGAGINLFSGGAAAFATPVQSASAVAVTNFFTFVVGSPMNIGALNAGPYSGTNLDIADYLVMQVEVTSTATPGLSANQLITVAYDET